MSYQQDPNQQGYGQQQHYPQQVQQQYYPPPPGQHQGYPPPPGQQHQGYPPPPQQDQHQQQYQQHGGQQFGQPQQQAAPPEASDTGNFQGVNWVIKHRNTNSTLNVTLHQGEAIKAKSGSMIHMSPNVTMQGKIKVSMKKFFTGGEMAESSYVGPGTVALAPTLFGDIVTLNIEPGKEWNVGKDAFLACTSGVTKDTKSQGLGKAFFSGEDLFIYKVNGNGVAWLTSYGAIETKHLQQGEEHIVDNGHLVAWNCNYKIEKAGGGTMTSLKTGEGAVCRFSGPGTVYIQTRNLDEFSDWVKAQVGSSGGG